MMITDTTRNPTPTSTPPCPHSDGKGLPGCWDCAEESSIKSNISATGGSINMTPAWQTLEWPRKLRLRGGNGDATSPTTLPEVHHPEPGLEVYTPPPASTPTPAADLEVVEGPRVVSPDEKLLQKPPLPQAPQYYYPPLNLRIAEKEKIGLLPPRAVMSPNDYNFQKPAFLLLQTQTQPQNQNQTANWNGNGNGNVNNHNNGRTVVEYDANSTTTNGWDDNSSTLRTDRSAFTWHSNSNNNSNNNNSAPPSEAGTAANSTTATAGRGAGSRNGNRNGSDADDDDNDDDDDGDSEKSSSSKKAFKILGMSLGRKTLYILIAVTVLALIAIVVGIAVGVTQGGNSHKSTSSAPVITQTVSLYVANGSTSFITLAATTSSSSSNAQVTATAPATATTTTSSSYTGNNSSRKCISADNSTYTDADTNAQFRLECSVEHRGIDLENVEAGTMEECVSLCAQNSHCAGAVWYNVGPQGTNLNYCWLKSMMLDEIDVTADAQSVVRLWS